MRPPTVGAALRRVAVIAVATALVAACGGRQVATTETAEPEPEGCCVDERWATPPPGIGQTPPETPAPEGALDPFVPETSAGPE